MRLSSLSFLLALLVPAGMVQAQTALPAGTTHYTIYQNGKKVGSTSDTVTPTNAGYTITSNGDLRLPKLTYSFENTQYLDHMLNLVSDRITGTVNNSPVTFSINTDSTGRKFDISVTAKDKTSTATIDRHQHLALLADLDSAGYLLLAHVGMENPQVSWALIPKQNGLLVPTTYTSDPSVRGRMGGDVLNVLHTTVEISAQNSISEELFYTREGQLLEADLPEQNFYVIRDGFKLLNRPKFAPPRSPEPTPPPQQNGQPPQGSQQGEYSQPPQQQ